MPLLLLSCKDELREVKIMKEAEHCYDNSYSKGELWTDCGDECDACKMKTPTCNPPDNQLKLNGTSYGLDSMKFHLAPSEHKREGVTAYFNGGVDLEIRVYTSKCEQAYEPNCLSSNLYEEKAFVKLSGNKACSGKVFIGTQNGNRYMIACNAPFQNGNDTLQYFKAVQP
ncbi:MAG: hypothetical protein ABEH38_08955 [Flavobacteriales bacterium]